MYDMLKAKVDRLAGKFNFVPKNEKHKHYSGISHQNHLSMKFRFQMLLALLGKCQTKREISVKF